MVRNNAELVDKWTLRFDEVSNNVYKVELTDRFGRQSGTTDDNLDRAIETCISYAFDIEKQLGNSLNKFTYDTFKYFLADQNLTVSNYSDKYFGSWTIEKNKKRIILDGRDLLLTIQNKAEASDWKDDFTIKLEDCKFEQLKELKDKFKNDN
ncbi:hypothetical protein FAZ19_19110 [Sphingobacterium alkalisoli]|uniref:Uncharacterized protein n=1 Tax=Sphingobacterium alkalisoli TaxID=1874115 RepID=A0A4U0GUB2_9SPHI|nr:hypothetical protein [Sphingobacterium alkalisoli]TJY62583.1 hypothetical protein FAZ19_19110 [Sphingobacterium alkalisoli]GGH27596.1 hypothetical protein GCM10011418_37620 [Sphingobacterium alkalisoli]